MPKVDSCSTSGHDLVEWRGRDICMECGYFDGTEGEENNGT
jgi:hypothetical protein